MERNRTHRTLAIAATVFAVAMVLAVIFKIVPAQAAEEFSNLSVGDRVMLGDWLPEKSFPNLTAGDRKMLGEWAPDYMSFEEPTFEDASASGIDRFEFCGETCRKNEHFGLPKEELIPFAPASVW